jgi:SAM-dependent methyltransferase
MIQPNDAATHWNERFAAPGYRFGTAPNRFLESQRHRLTKGMRGLAVADGEGRNGVWLARQGLDVTSVDISPVGQAKARALAKEAGVVMEIIEADLATWTWPVAAYDLVAAIFMQFAPPPLRAQIFAAIQAALKPGGLLILEGYRPKQLGYGTGGPPVAENMYTRELLESAFAAMDILHLAEYDAAIEEGSGHKGMSALIDLVARKRV